MTIASFRPLLSVFWPLALGFALAYGATGFIGAGDIAPPPAKPQASQAKPRADLQAEYAAQIKQKNILRLAIPAPKVVEEAAPPPPQDPTRWRMLGIALGKKPTVLLSVDGKIMNVEQGQEVHGWTLAELYPKKAVWTSAPHVREVEMFKKTKEFKLVQGMRNTLTLNKEEARKLLKDPNAMIQQALFKPHKVGNDVVGFRLTNIRSNSIFKRLGIRNGDVMRRINGVEVTSPTKLLEVYPSLQGAAAINLEIEREGNLITLVLEMEE